MAHDTCCCLDLELQEDALALDVGDAALEWGSDEYVRVVNATADEYDGPYEATPAASSHDHAIADVTGLQTALDGKSDTSHTHSGYQPTLVSGTNIKTVNGTSLVGPGDITTPTYTLPAATTSTLGGVKVDGTTITANDGVISAVGGGGGGGSTLTLYTNDNCWNLYVDSALATSLLESVDYDYDAAMSMLKNAGKVIVEWTDTIASAARYAVVCGAFYDTIDETFNVALIKVTSVATLTSIGLT